MIDWIQAVLPYPHTGEITGGLVQAVDPDGLLSWQRTKFLSVEGSYSSNIALKSQNQNGPDHYQEVYISGNPAKFLQGHNAFGSDDVLALLCAMAEKALQCLGYNVTEFQRVRWLSGDGVQLTMVDITYMYDLSSREQARTWIRALAHTGHMRHRGRGEFRHETLYYGRKSRRWALKVYCKGDEIECRKKGHKLGAAYETKLLRNDAQRILNYCDTKIRFELRLLPMELKQRGLHDARLWKPEVPQYLYRVYSEKLEVSPQKMKEKDEVEKLTGAEHRAYTAWKRGLDLRAMYTRPTYYRLRASLKKHGIDIGAAPPPYEESKVVEMVPVVVAKPATIPEWALGGRHTYFDTEKYRTGN